MHSDVFERLRRLERLVHQECELQKRYEDRATRDRQLFEARAQDILHEIGRIKERVEEMKEGVA